MKTSCLCLPKVLRDRTGSWQIREEDETWVHLHLSLSPPFCYPAPPLVTHYPGLPLCFPGSSCWFLSNPSLTVWFPCSKNDEWLPKRSQAIKTFILSFQVLFPTAPTSALLVHMPFSMLPLLLELASASHFHLWKSYLQGSVQLNLLHVPSLISPFCTSSVPLTGHLPRGALCDNIYIGMYLVSRHCAECLSF